MSALALETSPEAVMRAAGLLRALHAEDGGLFDQIMRAQAGSGEPNAEWHTFAAVIALADRLLDHAGRVDPAHGREELLGEGVRLLLANLAEQSRGGMQ